MKLTKTIALAALVAGGLLTGLTLQAQDAPKDNPPGQRGGPGMRGPNIEQMAKELNLSDEQKTKVKAALEERMQKARELRQDTNLSQEDRRAKMQEIQKAFTAKMKEILTAEQFEKWQKNLPQRNRPGQNGAEKPAKKADK
jgi:Spy/CpxP family protein refolding chaperone